MVISYLVMLLSSSTCEGASFLESSGKRSHGIVSKEDVERTLLAQFSSSALSQIQLIEEEIRPMYMALPKTDGSLAPSTVRYAVHRYFSQKYGWYMKGLDPTESVWNMTDASGVAKDMAPAFIQSLIDNHLHGRALGLREVAVFAAALSSLVHQESSSDLMKIFKALGFPTVGPIATSISEWAVRAYFVFFLHELDMKHVSSRGLRLLEDGIADVYPAWNDTHMWILDHRQTYDMMHISERNPFVVHQDTFQSTESYLQMLGHDFGQFQKLECSVLKDQLVKMEHRGTGRVRLSRFYAGSLDGDWTFAESVDYLRNVGALDESDPSKISVLIPNYIISQTNCLTGSGFYSICCANECEGLLQELENDIGDAYAQPDYILKLVSTMSSDTVEAPRNLSSTLKDRLAEVAAVHGGLVPLHGRLFAQWLHHAYPRECPFPHLSGSLSPMAPDEWMSAQGTGSVEATREEMEMYNSLLEQEAEEELSLPWTSEEELVAEFSSRRKSWAWVAPRGVMAAAALLSFMVPLLRAIPAITKSVTGNAKPEHVMV